MATVDLRVWAVKGAEQRLLEIADEARTIFATFPELRAQGRGFELPQSSNGAAAEPRSTRGRKRRRMSAAARKRIGDAQRKRWADVKARADADGRARTGAIARSGRTGSRRKK